MVETIEPTLQLRPVVRHSRADSEADDELLVGGVRGARQRFEVDLAEAVEERDDVGEVEVGHLRHDAGGRDMKKRCELVADLTVDVGEARVVDEASAVAVSDVGGGVVVDYVGVDVVAELGRQTEEGEGLDICGNFALLVRCFRMLRLRRLVVVIVPVGAALFASLADRHGHAFCFCHVDLVAQNPSSRRENAMKEGR